MSEPVSIPAIERLLRKATSRPWAGSDVETRLRPYIVSLPEHLAMPPVATTETTADAALIAALANAAEALIEVARAAHWYIECLEYGLRADCSGFALKNAVARLSFEEPAE